MLEVKLSNVIEIEERDLLFSLFDSEYSQNYACTQFEDDIIATIKRVKAIRTLCDYYLYKGDEEEFYAHINSHLKALKKKLKQLEEAT